MSLSDYIPFDQSKPDEFEHDDSQEMSFPCCACKHQRRPENECMKCAHYAA